MAQRWDREMMKDFSADDILDSLGLVRKSQQASLLWPVVGGVALGLCAGVAIGMAFAPKPGAELRNELGEKLKDRDYRGVAETARQAVSDARSQAASRT